MGKKRYEMGGKIISNLLHSLTKVLKLAFKKINEYFSSARTHLNNQK